MTAPPTVRRPRAGSSSPPAEMYLFGEVGWDFTASDVVAQLRAAAGGPVIVNLSSGGGDAFDGLATYEALRQHPGRIEIRVTGYAASAASVIAMAADDLAIASSASLMIHECATGTWGDQAAHLASADLLGRVSDTIAGIYAARAGGTAAEWRKTMRSERWYSASEEVAAGLADRVLDPADAVAAHLTGVLSAALSPRRRQPRQTSPDGAMPAGRVAAQLREGIRAGAGVVARAGGPARRPVGRRAVPSVMPLLKAMKAARR